MRITRRDIELMAATRGFFLCKAGGRYTPWVLVTEDVTSRSIPLYSLKEGGELLARKAAIRSYADVFALLATA